MFRISIYFNLAKRYVQLAFNYLLLGLFRFLLKTKFLLLASPIFLMGFMPCEEESKEPISFYWGDEIKNGVSSEKLSNGFAGCLSFTSSNDSNYHLSLLSSLEQDPSKFIYWSADKDLINLSVSCSSPVILPKEKLKAGTNYIAVTDNNNNLIKALELEITTDGKLDNYVVILVDSNKGLTTLEALLIAMIGFIFIALSVFVWSFARQQPQTSIDSRILLGKRSSLDLDAVKNMIASGELEKALSALYDYTKNRNQEINDEIILLQSQLSSCNKQKSLGLIDFDFYDARRNRLALRAINLLKAA